MTARAVSLSACSVALVWMLSGAGHAQTTSPGTQDCADFDTQEAAQAFYDQHKTDDPANPDPFDLDTDGDGKACEGLPTSAAQATTSPSVTPTATVGPTPTPGTNALGNTGAETGVLALSGLSLLEAGYGLTLASKRLGIRRRAIPLYLVRKFASAARRGEGKIEIGQDMYLVHRSVLDSPVTPIARVPEIDREKLADELSLFATEPEEEDGRYMGAPSTNGSPVAMAPNVYAALARPDVMARRR